MPAVLTPPAHASGVIARYVLLGAAAGLAVGVLWVVLAPRVLVVHADPPAFVDAYPQGFAAADLTLGALLLAAGTGLGIVAALRLRRTGFIGGWSQVAGVLVASVVCGAVARVTGWWWAGRLMTPSGDNLALPLTVQASGVLLLAAFSSLIVVILYAAFAYDPTTGSEPSAPSSP